MMKMMASQRGWAPPARAAFERDAGPGGALFVGHPEEIAERVVRLHRQIGHDRQILQMDLGHRPQKDFLRSIELLGTEVKPLVVAELGTSRKGPGS